jgi:protein MAK16
MTKIGQTLRRMRRLILKTTPKLQAVHKKIDRRESKRELKAHQAARLEITIEKELLNRLKMGVYPDGIVNESSDAFAKAMDTIEEMNEEAEVEEDLEREFVEFSGDEDDLEDMYQDDDVNFYY